MPRSAFSGRISSVPTRNRPGNAPPVSPVGIAGANANGPKPTFSTSLWIDIAIALCGSIAWMPGV